MKIILIMSMIASICYAMGPRPYSEVNDLMNWVESKGGELESFMTIDHSEGYRSTHASAPIKKGETVLFVPYDCILTHKKVKESYVGDIMSTKKMSLYSLTSTTMAMFLLYEKSIGDISHWYHVINALPKDMSNFPVLFGEKEMEYLDGSPFLEFLEQEFEDLRDNYNIMNE